MADLVRTTTPRARIPHRCHFCSTTINPGDTYHRTEGLWDGVFSTTKVCEPCAGLAATMFRMGWYSEGPDGEECYPWLPEVDYWDDVRILLPEAIGLVDAYHARVEASR